jgi:hypothetical protein
VPSARAALGWLVGAAALTFAVSWIGTTLLGLHHDLYYLIYFTLTLGYLAVFAVHTRAAWRGMLLRYAWWSLAVGALMAFAVVRQVMDQAGTTHPTGACQWFELVWRGAVYGSVDALVLGAFPAAIAYFVLRGDRSGLARKAAFAGLVLVFSLVVSVAYHLGYSTYRGSELSKPVLGTVMIDVPAVLTGNPVGAIVEHASVHTSAVVHQYYGGDGTNHFLPPELSADYPDRAGGPLGLAIAGGWLVVVGVALTFTRRRVRAGGSR